MRASLLIRYILGARSSYSISHFLDCTPVRCQIICHDPLCEGRRVTVGLSSRCFTETFELAIPGPPRLVSRQPNGVQCTTPRGTASALAASPLTSQRGAWHSLDDPPLLFAASCYVQEDEPKDEVFASVMASDKGGKVQRGRVLRSSAPSARLDQIAPESKLNSSRGMTYNECTR